MPPKSSTSVPGVFPIPAHPNSITSFCAHLALSHSTNNRDRCLEFELVALAASPKGPGSEMAALGTPGKLSAQDRHLLQSWPPNSCVGRGANPQGGGEEEAEPNLPRRAGWQGTNEATSRVGAPSAPGEHRHQEWWFWFLQPGLFTLRTGLCQQQLGNQGLASDHGLWSALRGIKRRFVKVG